MAKLDSILQITGSIGNLSFYKTQDGYIVRRKYGPTAERIGNDPAYARTRENNAEFARAGKATKLMHSAFGALLGTMSDNRVAGRLTREFLKAIRSDTRNPRGERTITDGDARVLEHFDFNAHSTLLKCFSAPFTASVGGSRALIDIPEFSPPDAMDAPEGATHFRLRSVAAVIDFTEGTWHTTASESSVLPLRSTFLPALRLGHTLPLARESHVFLLLGIEFLQLVNGTACSLKNAEHNPLAIVRVGWTRKV